MVIARSSTWRMEDTAIEEQVKKVRNQIVGKITLRYTEMVKN